MHTPPAPRPALGLPLALLFVALATACGGGGDDPAPAPVAAAPAPAPAPSPAPASTSRIVSLSMDFDANGVADATETATYDSAGRALTSQYRYTGDAVADRLNLAGTAATSNGYSYDAQGRPTRFDNTQAGGSSSFAFVYGADGLASSGTFNATSTGGSFSGSMAFAYTNGLLSTFTQTLAGQTPSITTYRHDARGRRIAKEEGTLRTDYSWDDDNRLTRVRRDGPSGEEVYTMRYAAGLQTETVKTVAGAVAYRVDFSHDARGRVVQLRFDRLGDGSVDAVWTPTWEDGPCIDTVQPLWDPLLDTRTGWGSSVRGETASCGR